MFFSSPFDINDLIFFNIFCLISLGILITCLQDIMYGYYREKFIQSLLGVTGLTLKWLLFGALN